MGTCRHENEEIRKQVAVNGVVHYRPQCLKCGRCGSSIARAALTEEVMANAPLVDKTIENRYWQAQRAEKAAQFEKEQEADRQARFTQMNNYYNSAQWWSKRAAVLKRDNHLCQAQLPGCVVAAKQVHHLTYDHFMNEPLFDLIAVCVPCHDQITNADRAARAAYTGTTEAA